MPITGILTDNELKKLRAAYDPDDMNKVLAAATADYPPVKPWLDGIGNTFYTEISEDPEPGLALEPINRERCLIAILGSRHETVNLAVHVYMGLMVGMTPEEVANILALTGAYCGVSSYIRGVRVEEATLTVLKAVAKIRTPNAILVATALNKAFSPSPER